MGYRASRNMQDWSLLCDSTGWKETIWNMASSRYRARDREASLALESVSMCYITNEALTWGAG